MSQSKILELIRQQRLRKVNRTVVYSEFQEKNASNHGEYIKSLSSLDNTLDAQEVLAEELRRAYYAMCGEYGGKGNTPRMVSFESKAKKSSKTLWKRVAASCASAEVTSEVYMRAQFAWFHKSFRQVPQVSQLTTDNAVKRAKEFSGDSARKIVGNDISANVSIADVFRRGEKMMQDICRAQRFSREEVYRQLVIPGLFHFDPVFLNADPLYAKVLAEVIDDVHSSPED